MTKNKKVPRKVSSKLHPRNKHGGRYDFKLLIKSCPMLAPFVTLNPYNELSIDFFNPEAVLMLNRALLKHYYGIAHWDIPNNYLCPPIPGRADYIHYIADLLGTCNQGMIPRGGKINCLDIGVGANCIYPIIGVHEFGWSFIGADIDSVAIKSANKIITMNSALTGAIKLRLQKNPNDVFQGIIQPNEFIDLTLCNPPFHTSETQARAGTQRKLTNLTGNKNHRPTLNFGGQHNELWCNGGEIGFVRRMIAQSKQFSNSCFWFSTLISKQTNLERVYKELNQASCVEIKTIPMEQGNKTSRIVAWTFLSQEQQKQWAATRWNT
ncbi:23S rRNA (adenine(1618)-N(6))-methyltransferase RlmF [uncultured Legionella sp.]|uniref:23S rRNA (adenine(1618)-N(6))-methyltransferase RlmF n=1 Tax=uncultured Legionella sp. TaxID=210934 RepID=UPI0026371123|nr:23S rRNA (adenine(1618)-N(6))-methyltransferase RlmF [uncultured Legionella sp.]